MATVKKGKRKVKIWLVMVIILVVIVAVLGGGILISAPGRQEIKELAIGNVDFQKLRDGTYAGEYIGTNDHSRDTKVQITISSGKISDIKILKGALDEDGNPTELTGGQSIENLFENVVKSQSLQVDAVSGATLTSKTHLKALENALKQAESE